MDYDAEFIKLNREVARLRSDVDALKAGGVPIPVPAVAPPEAVAFPAKVTIGGKGTLRAYDAEGVELTAWRGKEADVMPRLTVAGYTGPVERI